MLKTAMLCLVLGGGEFPDALPDAMPDVARIEPERLWSVDVTAEYAVPIPDSLVSHEISDAAGNTVRIVLEKSVSKEELTRLSGPTHSWPHMGCLMCLGNHLIGTHGQSTNYLHSVTYEHWKDLHDNLHNDTSFVGVAGSGEGWIGYEAGGGYSGGRTRLLQRLRQLLRH